MIKNLRQSTLVDRQTDHFYDRYYIQDSRCVAVLTIKNEKRGKMRKMKNKMAACLAAAILSMILMACGSTEDAAGAGQTAKVEEEALPESQEYVAADGTYSVTLLKGLTQNNMQLAANSTMIGLDGQEDRMGFSALAMNSSKISVFGNPEQMESLEDYADHLAKLALDGSGVTVDWEETEAPSLEGAQRCIAREGTAQTGGAKGKAYGCYMESGDNYYGVLVIGNDADVEDARKVLSIKILEAPAPAAEKGTLGFINSMTAVLDSLNGVNVVEAYQAMENMGADEEQLSTMQSQTAASLSENWGVEDAASLLEMADWLMTEGHNADALQFLGEYEIAEDMGREDLLEKMDADGISDEDKNALLAVYDARASFGDAAILAWDLSRVGTIMEDGYVAGYCTYEEAMDKTLEAALKAQQSFSSWDEFNQSYLYGYLYWTGESPEDSDAAQRADIIDFLSAQENGVFSIDWNTELKKEW